METLTQDALSHDFEADQRQVEIDGRSLNYVELGDPEKPVLLYVHGLMGTWRNWIFNLLPFADRFRVIAVDLPGFGDSEMPSRQLTIDNYADTLVRFINALGLQRVTLVGNSMGGQIAAVFGKKTPELAEHIVLVDAAGFSTARGVLRALAPFAGLINWIFPLAARFARAIAFNRWLVGAFLKLFVYKPARVVGDLALLLLVGAGKAGFVPAVHTITQGGQIDQYPGEITARTTIIWGAHDMLIPKSDAFRFAKMIPQAQLELLEDVGHIPMFETPDRFNEVLAQALDETA